MGEILGATEPKDDGEALREMQSKHLEHALSSITDFVYSFDLQGRFTYVNKPLLDLWGLRLEQAVGCSFHQLPYPTDLAQKLQDQIQQVIRTRERLVDETRYDGPDGSIGFYEYIFSPVFGSDGEVIAVAGTTRNITEIRRLELEGARNEREMAAGRSNLAEVINKAPTFIAVLEGPDHLVAMANELYFELVGRRDILGKPIRVALPEIEGQGFFELLDQVYETGEPFVGNEAEVELGPPGARKNRIVNFIYQALRGPAGDVSSIFVHGIDVTDSVGIRRKLEESQRTIAAQRRVYEAILSNTPDLGYVLDLNHRFIYANEILLKLWGVTEEDAIGKNCLELGYEPWHAEMHDRDIETVIATKAPVRGEVPFTGTFGPRIYDYIFVPVLDSQGNVEAVAGTTRDITDYVELRSQLSKQADEIARESKTKDEFLAMLSHELRNPLASIYSAVQLLDLHEPSAEIEVGSKAREVIGRQVTNLTKIVDDLLEVSRFLSGRVRLDLKPADLNMVVQHAVETTAPNFDQRQHTLTVHPFDEPVIVNLDLTRMEEVLVNLLNNAAKYTNDRGSIQVFCERPDQNTAWIRVIDNGFGIDDELLPKIFDVFTQGDRSLDRSSGGLGLGLNVALRLVQLHGGSIEVISPPPNGDRGSEFKVILPLVSEQLPPAPLDATLKGRSANGIKVLLVDDNADFLSMLGTGLSLRGFEIRMSNEGDAALREALDWGPDIILLDIGLPGTNGFEVAKKLRSHPEMAQTKIIAVSGYGQASDLALSEAVGFDAHLTKPIRLAELEKYLTGCAKHNNDESAGEQNI